MSRADSLRRSLYFGAHRAVGSRLGSHYRSVRDTDRGDHASATARLGALIEHARARVPYYRDLPRPAGPAGEDPVAALAAMPLLTRDLLQSNFERLKSDDLERRRWTVNASGGSTGEPVMVVQDRVYADVAGATQLLIQRWAGREIGERAVFVWGSERDLTVARSLRGRVLTALANEEWLNAFRMSEADMRACLMVLDSRPPRLIVGYAHALYELASFAERTGVAVRPQRAVQSSAGTLHPWMRETTERIFGCAVFDRYGCRELGDIASECEAHDGLHVLDWSNWVEVVDAEGRPVPDGTPGDLAITSLANFAMPLIRYAIGDRAVRRPGAQRCACGRRGPKLERVTGRTTDVFRTSTGVRVDGEFFTHLMYHRPWVRRFQFIQDEVEHVRVRIVAPMPAPPHELDDIREKIRVVMGSGCKVSFDFPDEIATTSSGKYRFTMSQIGPGAGDRTPPDGAR